MKSIFFSFCFFLKKLADLRDIFIHHITFDETGKLTFSPNHQSSQCSSKYFQYIPSKILLSHLILITNHFNQYLEIYFSK